MSTMKYCGFQTRQREVQKSDRIRSCKKAGRSDYGRKWYNNRASYGQNDNIKEKDHDSIGMHVTGIATGN